MVSQVDVPLRVPSVVGDLNAFCGSGDVDPNGNGRSFTPSTKIENSLQHPSSVALRRSSNSPPGPTAESRSTHLVC